MTPKILRDQVKMGKTSWIPPLGVLAAWLKNSAFCKIVTLFCTVDSVPIDLVSLHLTSQILLEGELLQTQLLEFILKQKQGKVFYLVLLCCGTKLPDLYEMKKT